MSATQAQAYLSVCKKFGEAPLRQLQEALEDGKATLDVSAVYVPRKHLGCVLQLVEERPDIEELVLDGAHIGVTEARILKEHLMRSCVSTLSLQGIKLDAPSTSVVRQLCIENPNLVSIRLNETCVPCSAIDEILLIVDLNRLNAESLRSTSLAGAQQEASAAVRWRLYGEKKNHNAYAVSRLSSSATRRIVDDFVGSYESDFSDVSFRPADFNHPVAESEVIRWNTYCAMQTSSNDELSAPNGRFVPSSRYNNRNLCAALNVLRFYNSLSKSLLLKGYPQPGLYVFRLFVNGSPVEVCVDDLVPCTFTAEGCSIIGLSSCSSPFYASMLEKAAAKAIGGYRFIEELSLRDCIELLTGCTCFEVDLLSRASSSSVTFHTLRSLSENGHRLVACAIPRTSVEERTFEESGVCCGIPYAILKTDICRKNGAHYAFLIQVAAPSSGKPLKYAFERDTYRTEEANGNCISWLTIEDFAVLFERVHLLLWPFDDAFSDHKSTATFHATTVSSSTSSQFARNPSFLIQNEGNSSSPVVVSVEASHAPDTKIGAKCLFFKSDGAGGETSVRRYNVCETNAVFASEEFEGNEACIFLNLLPKERLQMALSSRVPASFGIRISAVDNASAIQLPESMIPYTFCASWNTVVKAKRFSDEVFFLESIGGANATTVVISLSQATRDGPPFPVGVLGWRGTSADVVDLSAPHFSTQQERSAVCVHSCALSLASGESFFLLPYCCGGRCPNEFDLTVFCEVAFTQGRLRTSSIL